MKNCLNLSCIIKYMNHHVETIVFYLSFAEFDLATAIVIFCSVYVKLN